MQTPPFDPKILHDLLATIAAARPKSGAPEAEVQAANLAAFSAANVALSETYLALAKEQVAQLSRQLADQPDNADAIQTQLAAMSEAAAQAAVAAQAELVAGLSPKKETK